jgi:hypothetical protein
VQFPDRTQYPLAMSEQHAELFEICLSQVGQGLGIDRVFAKDRSILLQPKAAQPTTDIQGVPAFGKRDFDAILPRTWSTMRHEIGSEEAKGAR